MSTETHTAETTAVGPTPRRRPMSVPSLMVTPFAMFRAAKTVALSVGEIALALPKIARAMDELTATSRELAKMRGAIDRLEKLGGFLCEEIPETQHELEELRAQLARYGRRVDAVADDVRASTAVTRELTAAMRAFTPLSTNGTGRRPSSR